MKYFILLLALAACEIETPSTKADSIVYVKDSRTDLCFVITHTYGGYSQFNNVPCTPEVERLISK